MTFLAQLSAAWQRSNSLICVGLDPDPARLPKHLPQDLEGLLTFNKAIIDATHDLVCAYKPQIAYFAAQDGEEVLRQTIAYIKAKYPQVPVILDSKRGDIGSTAKQYAIEAFERYQADAVTINPYMGYDTAEPFLAYPDKGVVVLCRTSNRGAADFQDLDIGGKQLFELVAEQVATRWNTQKNCMLVVGATWPEQMARVRAIVGDMPFLVPGVGAQGGDVAALVKAGKTADGTGLVINSSRAVLYRSGGTDFAEAAREEVLSVRALVNQYR